MNAKDLVKLIDTLVEKKLNAKIKQLIKEEVSSQVTKVMGTMLVEMVKNSNAAVINEAPQAPVSPIQTKNAKLNSALNETVRTFQPARANNLAELMGGDFEKVGGSGDLGIEDPIVPNQPRVVIKESDGANMAFLKGMINEGTTTGQQVSVLGTDAVPDVLQSVFKKDFRAVMRKMDEQKKTGTMGMIDPRSVLGG